MALAHNLADCTGRWVRHDPDWWRCDICGAVAVHSLETLLGIAHDNNLRAYRLRDQNRSLPLDQDGAG